MLRALAIAGAVALLMPTFAAAQNNQHGQQHKAPPGQGRPAFVPHGGPGVPPPRKTFIQHAQPGGPPPGRPAFIPHGGPGGPHPQFSYHGRSFAPVHIAPFIYPPGWAYRPWAVGAILPPIFLAPQYYYPDWAALGLDPPPPGAQWVRYGPDLLLVDVNTGQVLEVVPGVFYE